MGREGTRPIGKSRSMDHDTKPDKQLRIVFLGRTGSGKSATGNNILGKEVFESDVSASSVTKKCQRGTAVRFNRDIQIIDSPGLFDTGMTNADITREVVKCVGMTAPGPHVFVLVTRIDRFTEEEKNTVEHFQQIFGEEMIKYLIILFTRKDDLVNDGKTLSEYLKNVPPFLSGLVSACNNRCIAFNNRADSQAKKDEDVNGFLNIVDAQLTWMRSIQKEWTVQERESKGLGHRYRVWSGLYPMTYQAFELLPGSCKLTLASVALCVTEARKPSQRD